MCKKNENLNWTFKKISAFCVFRSKIIYQKVTFYKNTDTLLQKIFFKSEYKMIKVYLAETFILTFVIIFSVFHSISLIFLHLCPLLVFIIHCTPAIFWISSFLRVFDLPGFLLVVRDRHSGTFLAHLSSSVFIKYLAHLHFLFASYFALSFIFVFLLRERSSIT